MEFIDADALSNPRKLNLVKSQLLLMIKILKKYLPKVTMF